MKKVKIIINLAEIEKGVKGPVREKDIIRKE